MSCDMEEDDTREYPPYEKRPYEARNFTEEQWAKFVAARKKWDAKFAPLLEATRAAGRITEEDLSITVF